MKVEQSDIDKRIKQTKYYYDETLTIAIITLDNGFKVVGESACVDPANYNRDLGETLARSRAVSKLWAFFGFAMAEGFDASGRAKVITTAAAPRVDAIGKMVEPIDTSSTGGATIPPFLRSGAGAVAGSFEASLQSPNASKNAEVEPAA
jgi:N4 Gp49/Sf6 Gp66 family protein